MKEEKEQESKILNIAAELEKAKPYLDKFEKAKNFNSSRKDAYAELMAFYQGNQHLLKKYKVETPWVVNMNTPHASISVDNRVASLLANDYIGELIPLGIEDVENVDKLAEVYKREWKRLKMDDLVRECISNCAVVREGYVHIILHKNQTVGTNGKKVLGKMEAYSIEPARIFIDPNARSLKKARYLFVADRMSKEEVEEKYPKLINVESTADTYNPSDRGEVYYDNDYTTEQEDVRTVLTYYGKKKGKLKKVVLVSGIIVEEKDMDFPLFPIAQIRWNKAAQSCYGLSLMDGVLSLQKAVTSIESAITNTAVAYAAPSMMVRKGCGVDPKVVAKANGAPGVVYAVDGDLDNAIKPVIPPQIKQDTLAIKNDFINQIDKITGSTNQFLGDIGTAGNTKSGTENAISRATIIENKVLLNIKEFVEDITEIIVEYIKRVYAGETLSYNDGKQPNGQYHFTTVTLPKEKDMKENTNYNYYIELETKTPYNREKQKDLLLQIFQLERQYDTPIKTVTVGDIIKNSDIERKDEIIARFNSLTFQDAETKADAITQLYQSGMEFGIDESLLKQAMSEIIANQKDTPAVEEVLKQIEQLTQQQIQQANQQMDNATETLMASPQGQADINGLAQNLEGPETTMLNQMEVPREA
ncbi:MAG: hypothetical protein IJ568_06370 [Bacilli bacterium]|nr:hypothetical protein [Bacilli bacterium]